MPPKSSVSSGDSIRSAADGSGVRPGGFRAVADRVVSPLPRQRRLAAACRVVQIERVELVLARRRDRQIAIAPAVRIAGDLVANLRPLAIKRQLAPQLSYRLDGVARIEAQRALARQAAAPVAPEFEAQAAAFERVNALEQGHRLEPPQ